ncbi:MAG: hypothetical protein ACOX4D_06425 [Bacteroidales bacterium]
MKWIKSYHFWTCVVISLFSWFIFYLLKPMNFNVKLGLNYKNIPDGYVITEGENKKINLSFNIKGNEVNDIRNYYSNLNLYVDLNKLSYQPIKEDSSIISFSFSPSSVVKNQLLSYHKSNVAFEILTDSITILLQKSASKKIPIVDGFSYTIPSSYMKLTTSGFNVDSVTITGLQKDIDKIDSLVLGNKKLGYIRKNLQMTVYPEKNLNNIKVTPNMLEYNIDMDLFTENEISIPIQVANGLNYKFFPNNLLIKYNVLVKDFFKVKSYMFKYKIEFVDNSNICYVHLTDYPNFIKLIDCFPTKFEYYIVNDTILFENKKQ